MSSQFFEADGSEELNIANTREHRRCEVFVHGSWWVIPDLNPLGIFKGVQDGSSEGYLRKVNHGDALSRCQQWKKW